MVHYDACPLCGSPAIEGKFSSKDHTVSGKSFVVTACRYCTGMFTQDAPSEKEIGPYYNSENYISHSDTKVGLVNSLYHRVRSITLKGKRTLLQTVTCKTNGNILDVGAGTGAFLHTMKEAGWITTGLEPDEPARKIAHDHHGLELKPISDFMALPAQSFDAITMWHVLEHVHELHDYLDQLRKLLKEDGRLFIAVPNYTSADAQHYEKNWAAYDVPRHLYHFSPKSIQILLEKHGLKLIVKKGMWFDSFYVSMLSEKYKTGNNNFIKAVLIGLWSNIKALFDLGKCSSVIYVIGRA